MNREITNKLNQILYLRAQNRTKETRRNKEHHEPSKQNFDDYFKDHVKEGHKSRNIRGLFRIPDVSSGQHLKINAIESDAEEEPEEQKMQIPQSKENQSLPHPKAMMSYPLNKPEAALVQDIVDQDKVLRIRKLYGIIDEEDEDEIYKIDKDPKSFEDYVVHAKNNPGEVIAVMNPWKREPYFVLRNEGKVTKLYADTDKSRYGRHANTMRKFITGTYRPSDGMYGELNYDKIDEIRLQEYSVKFDINKLPDDVLLAKYGNDDDDDDDKGGSKLPTEKEMLNQWNKALESAEEEEEEEEEYTPLLHKKKDDDDDNDNEDEMIYGTPKGRKSSDDYKLEIAKLTNEKDQLINDLEKNKAVADLEYINQQLKDKLEDFGKEIEYLKQIENSAEKDYRDLKTEYNKQVEDIHNMNYSNKELKKVLEENQRKYDEEIKRFTQAYETSRAEAAQEIEHIKKEYENKLKQMKTENYDLKQRSNEKDNEIKNLYQSMDDGNRIANQIQGELNTYKKKYHDLEAQRNKDLQSLNQKMQQQEGNFEATRQAEISQLSQALERLEAEKNTYINQIKEKEIELNNVKQYANVEYDKLKNEKEQEIQNKNQVIQKYNELEQRLKQKEEEENESSEYAKRLENYYQKIASNAISEYQRKNKEQEELIKLLTSQVQNISKPERIEEEIPQIPQMREGMLTRSQGPANTGQEMIQEIFDQNGNLLWRGMTFELAGKQYDAPEFVLNLIKYNKSNAIKNFKNAYEQRQQVLGDNTTYNNQKYVDKAVAILEQQFDYDKQKVALVMKYMIDKNPSNIVTEFNKKYMKDYAQYIKK